MEWQLWISIGCIIAGLLLIFLEVANPGFFIAVPGTVLLGFGFLSLAAPHIFFDGGAAAWTIAIFFVLGTPATIWAYKRWAPPGDRPVTLSNDSLPGREGKVVQTIAPGMPGKVRVSGQTFGATAQETLAMGTPVRVISVDGLTLHVES